MSRISSHWNSVPIEWWTNDRFVWSTNRSQNQSSHCWLSRTGSSPRCPISGGDGTFWSGKNSRESGPRKGKRCFRHVPSYQHRNQEILQSKSVRECGKADGSGRKVLYSCWWTGICGYRVRRSARFCHQVLYWRRKLGFSGQQCSHLLHKRLDAVPFIDPRQQTQPSDWTERPERSLGLQLFETWDLTFGHLCV